mmetsp:Transcript_113940/g.318326  ORF Transcript_113940/g.318326 Transcript_113940/m.318326 type:complete len:279 (+) Transcript_113940:120-956(+)
MSPIRRWRADDELHTATNSSMRNNRRSCNVCVVVELAELSAAPRRRRPCARQASIGAKTCVGAGPKARRCERPHICRTAQSGLQHRRLVRRLLPAAYPHRVDAALLLCLCLCRLRPSIRGQRLRNRCGRSRRHWRGALRHDAGTVRDRHGTAKAPRRHGRRHRRGGGDIHARAAHVSSMPQAPRCPGSGEELQREQRVQLRDLEVHRAGQRVRVDRIGQLLVAAFQAAQHRRSRRRRRRRRWRSALRGQRRQGVVGCADAGQGARRRRSARARGHCAR